MSKLMDVMAVGLFQVLVEALIVMSFGQHVHGNREFFCLIFIKNKLILERHTIAREILVDDLFKMHVLDDSVWYVFKKYQLVIF